MKTVTILIACLLLVPIAIASQVQVYPDVDVSWECENEYMLTFYIKNNGYQDLELTHPSDDGKFLFGQVTSTQSVAGAPMAPLSTICDRDILLPGQKARCIAMTDSTSYIVLHSMVKFGGDLVYWNKDTIGCPRYMAPTGNVVLAQGGSASVLAVLIIAGVIGFYFWRKR